jgi:hypothetical protein
MPSRGPPVRKDVVSDVLGVNYLMRKPITEDEAERVLHALYLANYEVTKRPPEVPSRRRGKL